MLVSQQLPPQGESVTLEMFDGRRFNGYINNGVFYQVFDGEDTSVNASDIKAWYSDQP